MASLLNIIKLLSEIEGGVTIHRGIATLPDGDTINLALEVADSPTFAAYRAAVKDKWHDEGVVEIDDNATVSECEEGAYVQAWVWVSSEDAGIESKEEEDN